MSKWQIHRRTFLRGLGAAVALPALDAMIPSLSSVVRAETVGAAGFPKRMAFVYIPNGATMEHWVPTATGAGYELPRILKNIEAFKGDFNICSGLDQHNGYALGDGGGDHARALASFLTGAHPYKTAGKGIKNGISVDQIAAAKIGDQTQLPSLEMSCDIGRRIGACDTGYSCTYSYNVSWKSDTMPMNPETEPRAVFERLFGTNDASDTKESLARRQLFRKSILDFVQEDADKLQSVLGRNDNQKLDQYMEAIREIEKRIEAAEKYKVEKPAGAVAPYEYENFEEHVKLMFDMLVLAFQTDCTRVSTFILSHEGSNRPYPFIGVTDGHHDISHHRNEAEKIEHITQINEFHMKQFAYFLGKLKSVQEGDSNLLDNSMIVYGSGISDGNRHSHSDLPVILAGRGGGTIKTGRHLRASDGTPLNNLYLSMLDRMGATTDRFGDSTGQYDAIG